MSIVEIENELEKMTDKERYIVIDIATKLIRGGGRPSLSDRRAKLKTSADIMKTEYAHDPDLIDLTVLDGEDFIDE